jgi:iron complex outermembrane receptor protein
MKITFFSFAIAFLISNTLLGQNTLIVHDLETNQPLVGANVLVLENQNLYVTDESGKVPDLQIDTRVQVTYIGYVGIEYRIEKGINRIYLEPNYELLNTLTVMGYDNDRKLGELSGSYAINSRLNIDRFNDESLVRSMNTLPGIRFEERSPSSYRISIRGNLLRAPFGVRNVKVYWNDIPYTDPTGNTPINLMDMNNIGKVETIKGPAGSVYGAGIGGVLNIYSEASRVKPIGVELGYTAGSYGFQKATVNLNTGNQNSTFSVRYAKQKGEGYRDHTNFDREVIQMSSKFYTSEKRTLTAQILYSNLFYQLPGGLTWEQYDENPRQARPGAAAKNSSIDHQNFMAGLVQNYEWNDKVNNTTAIYFTNGFKENPFINNYELEKLRSFGGRSVFKINSRIGQLPMAITTGAEINYGDFHAASHGNGGGYADTLRYEDELKSLQTFAFLQADINLSSNWILNAGASLNYLRYDIDRLRDVELDTAYQIDRTFTPEFIPRIGIVGKLTESFSVHGSISTGFSPPTTEEVRTSDGAINDDLEAEKGINYEVGIRGNTRNERLIYDATAFWMQQTETIVSKTTDLGTVVFENAGSTSQLGLEVLLGYSFINDTKRPISLLKVQTAYTHHNFTFQDYTKISGGENVDYSGNKLTGTAPNISVTTFDLATRAGYYFNLTYNFTDEIPLDDANTVFADSYQLVTFKTGWKVSIKQKHQLDVFLGIDNLLNEKYSLGNDLNAFGQRYYNASPERNCFGGLKVYLNKN